MIINIINPKNIASNKNLFELFLLIFNFFMHAEIKEQLPATHVKFSEQITAFIEPPHTHLPDMHLSV